jgi:hypothetical protein
VLER